MKKLTAGIFATLLAVVSVDGAYAAIASQGYVDDKVGEVQTAVTEVEGDVSTLQSTVADKADKATTLSGYGITDAYTSSQGTALAARVSAVEAPKAQVAADVTGPVSGGTVYTAIQGVSGDVTGVTSDVAELKNDMTQAQTDISDLKAASANHVVKNESITGGTHTKITYDAKGLVTAGANLTADDIPTIPNSKVSGLGSLATKSSVAATDIANKAVTKEKLADEIVTSLGKADSALQQGALADYVTKEAADAAYADIATEGVASTASTNAQTALKNIGTLTDLTTDAKTNTVAAINEVASEAAAAATAAAGAKTAADTAQGDVNALETTVSGQGTRLTAAEGEIDSIQSEMENMATSETVSGLQSTVTNLQSTKQDKTDNTLTTTNKTVVGAINEVKATADKKQDKLTGTVGGSMQPVYLNNGTITAGTALGTLATKSKVTNTEVDDGALAQSKINGLATTLAAKLTTPPTSERGETGLYVLTYDGTDFQWEDIARTVE